MPDIVKYYISKKNSKLSDRSYCGLMCTFTVFGELDFYHETVGTWSLGSISSVSSSMANAMSLELEFGKHSVKVLVVVFGATHPLDRAEVVQGCSLLPKDAVGIVVVAR